MEKTLENVEVRSVSTFRLLRIYYSNSQCAYQVLISEASMKDSEIMQTIQEEPENNCRDGYTPEIWARWSREDASGEKLTLCIDFLSMLLASIRWVSDALSDLEYGHTLA